MGELDVVIPDNMQLPHSAIQVKVFERDRATLNGIAIHDRSTVGYKAGASPNRGLPSVSVVLGRPFLNLETVIAKSQLDGLEYPVLTLPD